MKRRMRQAVTVAVAAVALGAVTPSAMAATATTPATASGHALAAGTRFYVPPPAQGSVQQIAKLIAGGQLKDAGLLTAMEAVPSAVWLDGETTAQAALPGDQGWQQADAAVAKQVKQTLVAAGVEHAVPVFVAYNIPGRDCSQYSSGGAPTDAAYDAWIDSVSAALGGAKAVVLVEPDALANLPSYCGAAYASQFPGITDTTRVGDVGYAVTKLEGDPNVSVYLDGGNSAWQNVGGMAETLVAAGVQQAQGFFLNVSNYQYNANSEFYGTWVSSCIAYATVNQGGTQASALADVGGYAGSATAGGAFADCPNQYWNGGPDGTPVAALLGAWTGVALSPFGTWSDSSASADLNVSGIDNRYAGMLGATVPSTHFIVDTSRNGTGPDSMQSYAAAPYNQPASVISSLVSGNWCNPPSAGLGARPTVSTGVALGSLDTYLGGNPPLVDAYLWVKTPGQSDGQCDAAGGTRTWDDDADTPAISGWPASASAGFQTFDPLWSLATNSDFTDPAAGAWFSQQALSLARNASPKL